MARPDLSRVPSYYHQYINQVKEDDLSQAFRNQSAETIPFLENLPADKIDYRYAPGKWTIREVVQHILDAERIFSYRALCFARKDTTPLPSFDENAYADNSRAGQRDWKELLEELKTLRKSTEIMFRSFDAEQLETAGTASGKSNYVLGLGFIVAGHLIHHVNIIRERYLANA